MAVLFLLQLFALLVSTLAAPTIVHSNRPSNDTFYIPPKGFESAAPGTILRSRTPPEPIAAFSLLPVNLHSAHQLLYRTTDSFGDPIATVTTVLVPHNADYSKLLSYQVAQDAADPDCAPSYAFQLEAANDGLLGLVMPQLELVLIAAALNRGWVVTAPDHLGPDSAFLASKLSGHAILDGIRAAKASTNLTNISSDPTVTLWGYSGGSLTSGFAAEMQPSYAPDVKIQGAALGGTVPQILPVISATNKSPFAGLIPAGIQGLANEYPEIQEIIQENLLPERKAKFAKTKNMCLVGNVLEYLNQDIYSYVKNKNIFTSPTASKVLNANAMGQHNPEIPLLIYKSSNDEISPVNDTDLLVGSYCEGGTRVEYKRDFLSEHGSLAVTGALDALIWLEDRMNSVPVEDGCSNSTSLTSLLDPGALVVLGETLVQTLLTFLDAPVGPIQIG